MVDSWLKLSVRTSAASLDAASNFLIELGSPGVVVKRQGLEAYFPADGGAARLKKDARRFFAAIGRRSGRMGKTRLNWKIVRAENWHDAWRRFIKPQRIGKSFYVTPPWLAPPELRGRHVITIEPAMAFGTGSHATTRACMEFIEIVAGKLSGKKLTALDVGTGSGILAIALAKLGATDIWAIDHDPTALDVARENLRKNGAAEKVRLSGQSVGSIRKKFSIVAANLTAETILELAGDLEKRVAAKGYLILSGILRQKGDAVEGRFAGKFTMMKRKQSREWVSLLLRRK
ncbi:MAG TPA: 50S ribosomal protein L11 methyltransferase [Methylomirabilota bacterium]|nr:50S ribosomal protein L11 methyltransferase [Methylomirabilota bacterium]